MSEPPRLSTWRLIIRSLWFYRRTHLQVLLGTVFAAAVLIGALAVGDSVKLSLRAQAENRLGHADYAWTSGERFFRRALAGNIQRSLNENQNHTNGRSLKVVPLLVMPGTAVARGGAARANQVQVLGIDAGYPALARHVPPDLVLAPEEAAINQRLARDLEVRPGDELLLRLRLPSAMPSDAPLAAVDTGSASMRVRIKRLIAPGELGDFSLQANPVPPQNLFLPLAWLAEQLKITNRANLILVSTYEPLAGGSDFAESIGSSSNAQQLPGTGRPANFQRPDQMPVPQRLKAAFDESWGIEDAGFEIRSLSNGRGWELRSERLFLEPAIETALGELLNPTKGQPLADPVFSYFVNEIRSGTNATPYSIVTALGNQLLGTSLADDEMIITQWLADDLQAVPGSTVKLTYYVLGPMRSLQETNAVFRVKAVIPMTHPAVSADLMPAFPGLAGAGSCRDWDPGIPIDLNRIRKQDEAYWELYRGTPKAFVSLPASRRMWSNRYGNLTAIRLPQAPPGIDPSAEKAQLESGGGQESPWKPVLRQKITPELTGIQLLAVRQTGLRASQSAVDFGQLFLGLSFFLIIASLLLTTLLFVFGIEQRSEEIGTLKSLGFHPNEVLRLLLGEAAVVILIGVSGGLAAGMLYAQLLLRGLGTIWQGAVSGTGIEFHMSPLTAGIGCIAAVVLVFVALTVMSRRALRRTVVDLQLGGGPHSPSRARLLIRWIMVGLCLGAAAMAAIWGNPNRGMAAAGLFFGAGAVLLLGTLVLVDAIWQWQDQTRVVRQVLWWRIAAQNCVRRRGRSLAAASILACGTFMVLSVAANRHDPTINAHLRNSGTGGFAFYGESALPILMNLNTPEGRRQYALDEPKFDMLSFVSLRVRQGDDASCLNLNRAQQPRLLGVDIQELAKRKAFRFARVDPRIDPSHPWTGLEMDFGPNEVPAIVDDTVLTWGLGKRLGDTLVYSDELGKEFRIRFVGTLANSIFQGSIIISQQAFLSKYPSISGARVFLVDAPSSNSDELVKQLTFALQDWGVELVPTAKRLAEFNQVELTYLSIFGMLGGLGILLGAAGMGIMVMRNVLERRSELAALRAIGFSRRALRWLLVYEHAFILLAGIACGAISSLVAVIPALRTSGSGFPWIWISVVVLGSIINGLFWTIAASMASTRGDLLLALRDE